MTYLDLLAFLIGGVFGWLWEWTYDDKPARRQKRVDDHSPPRIRIYERNPDE